MITHLDWLNRLLFNSKKFISILKLIWFLFILLFTAGFAVRYKQELIEGLALISWAQILISFGFLLIGKIMMTGVVNRVVNHFSPNTSFRFCFYAYNCSQLPKYIPGSIWQYVSRVYIYKKHGFRESVIVQSILMETFWVLATALSFGAIAIVVTRPEFLLDLWGESGLSKYSLIILAITATLTLFASALIFLFRSRISQIFAQIAYLDIVTLLLLAGLWLSLGLSILNLMPMSDRTFEVSIYFSGVFAVAYCIGYVTPFAPAGLGVREVILVLGLLPFAPALELALVIGLHRLVYLTADVFIAFVAWCWRPGLKN